MATQTMIAEKKKATRRRKTLPPLKPIHNDDELDEATELSRRLVEKEEAHGSLKQAESDYLEALLILIEHYEDENYPMGELATPRERLAYLVKQAGMNASDLGRFLGNRPLGGKLLSGERELSKAHIRKLADRFHVNPGYFI